METVKYVHTCAEITQPQFQVLQKRNHDAFALRRTPRRATEPPRPPEGEGWLFDLRLICSFIPVLLCGPPQPAPLIVVSLEPRAATAHTNKQTRSLPENITIK